ncbi:MAG: DUF362 domain-containing protein [Candidatus Saganbacteria bacterium]|nr:DUF362 domain-containing protein [Candidatus Saganbacteria bacterium]
MSKVYITKDLDKVDKLFDAAGIGSVIEKDDFVALKIHFGERGNKAFVKPNRAKPVVKKVKALGGRPFWTDANTLYKGSRSDTLAHLQTAFDHGYTYGKTGAHVLIADGLEGKAFKKIKVDYKYFKELFVAPLIMETESLISIAHFKGHEVTGFGGAIKNISMGLASRAGKQQMHADVKPVVLKNKCTSCGRCLEWCPKNTIVWDKDKKAEIHLDKCIGCAECIVTCRFDAIEMSWAGASNSVQEKMAEYAAGVASKFRGKAAYINFICDVSENCDCYNFNSEPIVPDIGILASFDPVAIDQACVDLVNKTEGRIKGKDKLKTVWPSVDWSTQLKHAEEIGLGTIKYELKVI